LPRKKRPPPLKIPPAPRRRTGTTGESRNQVVVVAAFVVLLAIVVGIIGFAFFQDYWEENVSLPNSTALTVGETSFDLDYFARRLELLVGQVGSPGQTDSAQAAALVGLVGDVLEQEELLRQRAGPDLGIAVSTEEIEQQVADRVGVSLADREQFDKAYEEEVERSGLSDREFWEMTGASVLGQKVGEAFNNSVPAAVEQARLRLIRVPTEGEASTVRERLDAGEDFGELARELSQDEDTKEAGGEMGWVVLEELGLSLASEVFALEVGTLSENIEITDGFVIFEMMEKDSAHEVSETQRSAIGSSYFGFWVDEQRTLLSTINFIRSDSAKIRWVVERAFDL
jgi:hypothetical protein